MTTYTVSGDPHFIDRASSSKIVYTQHTGDKVTYYDPGTNTQTHCSSTNLDGADDIDSYSSTSQYATAYNAGKVVKTVKGTSSCTITSYTVPGTNPNPEGIDKSTDISGMFVIDQANKILYKFDVSAGSFTECETFTSTPWYVAVDDSTDLLWVTFYSEKKVRAVGTLSCFTVETSQPATNFILDVAVITSSFGYPVVTFADAPKVARYPYDTDVWTVHDWSTDCSSCQGFGIDAIYSTNTYYAAMRSSGGTSKMVVGSF